MFSIKYEELPPNTKLIFEELTEEYKKILILRAVEDNGYKNLEELRPSDLVIADKKIKRFYRHNNFKKDKMISFLRFFGLVYTFLGVCIYLYLNIDLSNDPLQMTSMLIGTTGIFIFILTYFYDFYKDNLRQKKTDYQKMHQYAYEYEIIRKWAEIEKLGYNIIRNSNNGRETDNIPISGLINELISREILDETDKADYKYVLNLRNNIAHPQMEKNTVMNINEGLYKADRIINKLKRQE